MNIILHALTGLAAIGMSTVAISAATAANPNNTPAANASNTQNGRNNAANERVCARIELTGSRVARTVCRTRAEWEAHGGLNTDR